MTTPMTTTPCGTMTTARSSPTCTCGVTSAKETNNSGSSTEDTDKGNGYTAETSMASNGRATVRLTANRPSYAAGR